MQQLKLKPLFITFIIAIILFVTSGFAYQYITEKKPMNDSLQNLKNSTVTAPPTKENSDIYVEIVPNENSDLDIAVQEVYAALNDYNYGNANIHVTLGSGKAQHQQLDALWKEQLFQIAEAMASQNYSHIPELMKTLESQDTALKASATIDNQYVYITLRKDQEVKYVLLPLQTELMEVWEQNEQIH